MIGAVALGRSQLDRVEGGNDRAEGMTEQYERLEVERLGERVDVAGEDLERECLRVDPVASSLPPLVEVEQPDVLGERIEVGTEHRVVEAWPAVQDDQC